MDGRSLKGPTGRGRFGSASVEPERGEAAEPPYPTDHFPGHSAWIDGDWKLHRIENKQGKVKWELYNLANDPKETTDLAEEEPARVKEMQPALEAWLKSVVQSLNGEDYAKSP